MEEYIIKQDISTEIFYFSGTGNSLFVAREISKGIPNSIITPIVACVSQKKCKSDAEVIGIVFPVHALTIPIVVHIFLRKLKIHNTKYIFSVATREGTVFKGFNRIESILRRKKKKLNSKFVINMCGNDSRHKYIAPKEDDIKRIERNVLDNIRIILEIVNQKKQYRMVDSSVLFPTSNNKIKSWFIETLVIFLMENADKFGGANYFYHDKNCNGCGICEKVCLSKKIENKNNEPIWNKKTLCYMCFACLNFCPKKSVQIHSIPGVESFSETNDRYQHPYTTVKDMEYQKNLTTAST
jgi:ferredoxin